MFEQIKEASAYIQERVNGFVPQVGIILGTGLGALINDVDVEFTLEYSDIPYFPIATVETHKGRLVFGTLEGKKVVVMQGRFHYYEGYSMQEVVFPVRIMKLLGIEKLMISNAAGSINAGYKVADLVIINDHINLQPANPLVGPNIDELGPRWPDMSEPYDLGLVERGLAICKQENISAHSGVYVSVPGPNLETKAEYRYLRTIGADLVGMSTVPEVIVAAHMGIPTFAVSVITDIGVPELVKKVVIEDIIAAAMTAEPKLALLFRKMLAHEA